LGASGTRYVPDPGQPRCAKATRGTALSLLHRVRASRGLRRGIPGRAGVIPVARGLGFGGARVTEPIALRGLNTAVHFGSTAAFLRGCAQ
jgi:hypothetical protein